MDNADSSERGHPGVVDVNFQRIIRLRDAKSWSQGTLAKKARCSVKTIKSIEGGRPALPCSLIKLGKAFGVPYETLKSDYVSPAPDSAANPPSTGKVIKLIVFIKQPLNTFDETKLPDMVEEIRKTTGIDGAIAVVSVTEGSVRIGLEMVEDDAIRLVAAFCQGRLDHLDIVRVTFSEASGKFAGEIEELAELYGVTTSENKDGTVDIVSTLYVNAKKPRNIFVSIGYMCSKFVLIGFKLRPNTLVFALSYFYNIAWLIPFEYLLKKLRAEFEAVKEIIEPVADNDAADCTYCLGIMFIMVLVFLYCFRNVVRYRSDISNRKSIIKYMILFVFYLNVIYFISLGFRLFVKL